MEKSNKKCQLKNAWKQKPINIIYIWNGVSPFGKEFQKDSFFMEKFLVRTIYFHDSKFLVSIVQTQGLEC